MYKVRYRFGNFDPHTKPDRLETKVGSKQLKVFRVVVEPTACFIASDKTILIHLKLEK